MRNRRGHGAQLACSRRPRSQALRTLVSTLVPLRGTRAQAELTAARLILVSAFGEFFFFFQASQTET